MMTGTNKFQYFAKYTHCGLIIKDDNNNIFILESSYGFEHEKIKTKCILKGIPLKTSVKDGLRLIPLETIKEYYNKHNDKYPNVKYYYFKQEDKIDILKLIIILKKIEKKKYKYPKSIFDFLPCILTFWPKTNSKLNIFCSEALSYILKKINFINKTSKLEKNYRYKPYDLIMTSHFPYKQQKYKITNL